MYKKPAELSQTSQITWVMFLPKIIKNQKNPDVTKRGDDDDDDIWKPDTVRRLPRFV